VFTNTDIVILCCSKDFDDSGLASVIEVRDAA